MNTKFNLAACGLAALLLPGCHVFDAKPAADSGYNPGTAPMATRAKFLQQTWVAPAYRGQPVTSKFSSVYVAPVDTSYLARQSWWQEQTAKQSTLGRDADLLSRKMRAADWSALANYPGKNLPVAGQPGPGVLVIELALVELVPSKAYWNAAATTAGFVVPGAGFLSAAGRGSIAIEGRLVNGATGEIIATFKDRRADKVAPVNLGSYSWYHGAEGNISDWASESAELLNTPPGHTVQRASAVTLKPW